MSAAFLVMVLPTAVSRMARCSRPLSQIAVPGSLTLALPRCTLAAQSSSLNPLSSTPQVTHTDRRSRAVAASVTVCSASLMLRPINVLERPCLHSHSTGFALAVLDRRRAGDIILTAVRLDRCRCADTILQSSLSQTTSRTLSRHTLRIITHHIRIITMASTTVPTACTIGMVEASLTSLPTVTTSRSTCAATLRLREAQVLLRPSLPR